MTFLGSVAPSEQIQSPGLRRDDALAKSLRDRDAPGRLLRLEVLITNAKFLPSITHQ